MNQVHSNVLYLLWQNDKDSARWNKLLARWTNRTEEEVRMMLKYGRFTDADLNAIATAARTRHEELVMGQLLNDPVVIRLENLRYLINQLPHGGKRDLAKALDVSPPTISKWLKGQHIPSRTHLRQIADFFGLSESTSLERTPLFLNCTPLTDATRRAALRRKIEQADAVVLEKYYDALERLLEG